MWRFAAIVVLVGVAHAAPFREQLTKDELEAAANAAEAAARLKADAAAAKQCEPAYKQAMSTDAKADEMAAAARCLRAAGSLGAAIHLWRSLIQFHRTSKEVVEAHRALGPAYEAAGRFGDAAMWSSTYAKKYGYEKDAAEQMTRAVCTWRQLGYVDEAERGFKYLVAVWGRKHKFDAATLCDQVRPIVVPPKSSPARP